MSSLTHVKYEKVMSDFQTQLRKPINRNPNVNWRATLLNAFLPIDLSLVQSANYTTYWFQYVWGEQKRLSALPVCQETRIGSKFDCILRLVWIPKGESNKQSC